MKALKFTLEGRTGFFKRPDVNSNIYFTYGHIHKVALLGIFGAILGYGGYNQRNLKISETKGKKKDAKKEVKKEEIVPEFYERLKDLKVSIVPRNKRGFIEKKVNVFNNSVGYASQEKGGNLIVKEQWLENPSWDIYVLLEGEEGEKISKALLNREYVYLPYLGKNDHRADILNVEINSCEKLLGASKIDSFFKRESFSLLKEEEDIFDSLEGEEEEKFTSIKEEEEPFKYEEFLPIALKEETNSYKKVCLVYTNSSLKEEEESLVYRVGEKNLQFI